jgi:ABC-type uncharacterized transport system involved in gliding motility auxiliary subunit
LFVSINQIAGYGLKNVGLDLTQNKIYTLSGATKDVLSLVDEPVEVKVFFSKELGEANPFYKRYFEKTVNLLEKFEDISNGRLRVKVYNPTPFSKAEDRAISLGLQNVPLMNVDDVAYFGISVSNSVDKTKTIPFLTLSREPYIEYDLVKTIYNVTAPRKKLIGLITNTTFAGKKSFAKWVMYDKISEFYDVSKLGTDFSQIPSFFDAIMIVHPENLKQEQLYAIDQYMVRGGKAFVFVDPVPEATYETAPLEGPIVGSDAYQLFKTWGIEFNPDVIVGDLKAARKVDASEGGRSIIVDDITSLMIEGRNFDKNSALFSGINHIYMSTVGAIEKKKDSLLSFSPIIISSKETMEIDATKQRPKVKTEKLINNFVSSGKSKVIAAYIHGKLKSGYSEKLEKSDIVYKASSDAEAEIIVVADVDMLQDLVWVKKRPFYGRELHQALANNADFVINCLDALTSSVSLTSLRGRGFSSRPFTKVLDMQKQADVKYRQKTKEILKKIQQTKDRIELITRYNPSGRDLISLSDKEMIVKYKQELNRLNLELRKINVDLKREVSFISRLVKFINIYAIALLILIISLLVRIKRHRAEKKVEYKAGVARKASKVEKRKIGFLFVFTFVCVLMAFLMSQTQKAYEVSIDEGKRVFVGLSEKIDDIEKIIVRDVKGNVELYKQDGFWKLKNYYDYPVSNALIKTYLIRMSELEYFEKKTALSSRFYKLGLDDVSDRTSGAVEHIIVDENANVISDYLFGKRKMKITSSDNGIYIRKKGENNTWLAKGSPFVGSSNIYDWIGSQLLEIPPFMIKKASFENDEGKIFDIVSAGAMSNDLKLEKAYKNHKKLENFEAKGITTVFSSFKFEKVVPKSKIKLDKKLLSVTIETSESLTIRVALYDYEGGYWAHLDFGGKENSKSYEEIQRRSENWLYKINDDLAKYVLGMIEKK